jgi:iron complex outermembrane receptor protein
MADEQDSPHYVLDPVVVTGSRIPDQLSKIGKSITVISREEIEALPVNSVSDVLENIPGVDVRQRGAHGVQADASIRGSSFEQTLILIDGINVNDAQTGHHNLDLPVNLEDIDRIEVVKGPAARIYGHNAMAGVINIITRDVDHHAVGGHVKYGEHDYYSLGAHGALKTADMSTRISASRQASTGHIKDEHTDFDMNTLAYKGIMNRRDKKFTVSLGYSDKDFGAYRFYSDAFPDQREQTETLLAYTSAHLKMRDLEIMPRLYWRRHDDRFKINISNNWLRNEHQTDSYGVQLNNRLESGLGSTAVGCEVAGETLESSNLGDHERWRSGVFVEQRFYPLEALAFGIGASVVHYSRWGWECWPGAEFNVELSDGLHWFGSMERSFRIPSFTEMFYDTAANQGNPKLKPEQAYTYESGFRWYQGHFGGNLSAFLRDEEDVIDWTRASDQDPWKARNIAEIGTRGFEIGVDFYPETFSGLAFISAVNIAYTYLDSDLDTEGLDSKYVLDHLRHQLQGSVALRWHGWVHSLTARYEERQVGDSLVLVDAYLGHKWHQYELFLEATNLFDRRYIESGFAPGPGRWIIGGMRFNKDFMR